MKCHLIIFFISLLLIVECGKWKDTKISYRKMDLRLIIHESVNPIGIEHLLENVEKSFDTKEPLKLKSYKGLIMENDIVVVSKRLLFWFSLTSKKNGRVVRSGGGLLAGLWELEIDSNQSAKLKRVNPETSYVQNLLLIGSEPDVKLFGADVFGGYSNNRVVWGIEYSKDVKSSPETGKDILKFDRGAYSPDEGVFIKTEGILGNSNHEEGIETDTDTDPRKDYKGLTSYTLTYRIPANRLEFIAEIEFKVKENNFGPISNAFLAMYLPGYSDKTMVYASNPELIPQQKESTLEKVQINKWFKNSAVKKSYFYDIDYSKHEGKKMTFQTPPGNGRILCVGSPVEKIGFFCGYPNNDYIPKETYEENTLELSDNQKLHKQGKFHTLNYKLLSSPNKTLTLKKGEKLIMIMRYKLINATTPFPSKKGKNNKGRAVKVK